MLCKEPPTRTAVECVQIGWSILGCAWKIRVHGVLLDGWVRYFRNLFRNAIFLDDNVPWPGLINSRFCHLEKLEMSLKSFHDGCLLGKLFLLFTLCCSCRNCKNWHCGRRMAVGALYVACLRAVGYRELRISLRWNYVSSFRKAAYVISAV